jgi:hypothetical protein
MAMERGFDADKKSQKRLDKTITIGGQLYRPVKKTGAVVKEILEIEGKVPPPQPDEDGNLDPGEMRQWSIDIVDNLYEQLSVLLVTADGENGSSGGQSPDPDELSEALDLEEAQELREFLMPSSPGVRARA